MLTENFYQILNQLAEWKLGTFPGSAGSTGRPPLDPDAAPENPYPVVTSFNDTQSKCDWCESICVRRKIYTKVADTDRWKGTCGDCKKGRTVTTEEMINFGRFTVAKDL
jgi:hypothetical protein